MNKIILGATLVAIAALVGSPILAEAVTDLKGVRVQMDNAGDFKSIVFRTLDVVPTDGSVFGGYAILTTGDFIAVTSHAGFLDSEAQLGDVNNAIWHSHLVQVSLENASCDVAISALSLEEPSAKVLVRDGSSNIMVRGIASGTSSYTDVISQGPLAFTVGNPIEDQFVRPNGIVESISFDLNEAPDGTICIGPVTPVL